MSNQALIKLESEFHTYQKALTDWTDESFTVIDKAITDADKFTG